MSQKQLQITKRDTEMFHDESWKLNYFDVKMSKSQVINIVGVGVCTLVSAGCFYNICSEICYCSGSTDNDIAYTRRV